MKSLYNVANLSMQEKKRHPENLIVLLALAFVGVLTLVTLLRDQILTATSAEKYIVAIYTSYPGAVADQVHNDVISIIEPRLQELPGVEKVTSDITFGMATTTIEFDNSIDSQNAVIAAEALIYKDSQIPLTKEAFEVKLINDKYLDGQHQNFVFVSGGNDYRKLQDIANVLVERVEKQQQVSAQVLNQVESSIEVRLNPEFAEYKDEVIKSLQSHLYSPTIQGSDTIGVFSPGITQQQLKDIAVAGFRLDDIAKLELTHSQTKDFTRAGFASSSTFEFSPVIMVAIDRTADLSNSQFGTDLDTILNDLRGAYGEEITLSSQSGLNTGTDKVLRITLPDDTSLAAANELEELLIDQLDLAIDKAIYSYGLPDKELYVWLRNTNDHTNSLAALIESLKTNEDVQNFTIDDSTGSKTIRIDVYSKELAGVKQGSEQIRQLASTELNLHSIDNQSRKKVDQIRPKVGTDNLEYSSQVLAISKLLQPTKVATFRNIEGEGLPLTVRLSEIPSRKQLETLLGSTAEVIQIQSHADIETSGGYYMESVTIQLDWLDQKDSLLEAVSDLIEDNDLAERFQLVRVDIH